MNGNTRSAVKIKSKKAFTWAIVLFSLIFFVTPIMFVQFICLFFIFLIICSGLYTAYLVRHIRTGRMDRELRVFRHEWVSVEIKVENRGFLPAFMLVTGDMQSDLPVVRMTKTFCTLYKNTWTLLRWDGLCAERGVFTLGPAVIKGADPLGLFPFHLTGEKTSKLYVYPSVRSVNLKNSRGIPLGNMMSPNLLFEDITRYRSLRPYYPGDEKRRINWKASARLTQRTQISESDRIQSSSLLVNEYEATASYPVMVFLNVSYMEYPVKNRRHYIERAIETAAALCLKASEERQALGIVIYLSGCEGGISSIPDATNTLVPILERLASLDWSAAAESGFAHSSMAAMLNYGRRLSYGTRYIYIGTDLGDEAYITLNLLKKHHLSLEYLIIDEHSLSKTVPGNSPRHQIKESGYEVI